MKVVLVASANCMERSQVCQRTASTVTCAFFIVLLTPSAATATATSAPRAPSNEVLQALVDGVQYGLVIAAAAVGLSLIYGTTKLINFAHGELITFGAIAAWYLESGTGLALVLAAVVAGALGAIFGALLERSLWRPLRRRRTGLFQLLIISLGLSLALRHIYLMFFGGSGRAYLDYRIQEPWRLWGVDITPRDLGLTIAAVTLLVAVAVMLQRTPLGQAMRAVADNRDLAEASGINVKRVILFVWSLGSGLAALGGVMLGLIGGITWDMGFRVLLLVFAGVILGGLGTAYGAMVGGVVIGVVSQMSTLYSPPELRVFWALLVLILVLLIRPEGVLGSRQLKRVG